MKSLHLAAFFMLIYCCTCATITDSIGRSSEDYLRTNTLASDGDGTVTADHNPVEFIVGKSSGISTINSHDDLRNRQNEESTGEPSIKEKRCKSSPYPGSLLGASHIPSPTLALSRRDIQSDLLKKRCETCKENSRCKKLGKCDICTKICDNYESSLNPKKSSKVLDIEERNVNEDVVGIANRIGGNLSDEVSGLSEKEDRYYTVGSFESGPVHNLLTRLLRIYNKDNIERLIVLAKAKTPGVIGNTPHPVVIDTAHVFTINEWGPKEIGVEVHKVKSGGDADDLASKLDRELDVAIVHKKKLVGDSHLTADEIDEIIDHAVGRFNEQHPIPNELVGVAHNLNAQEDPKNIIPQNTFSDAKSNETDSAKGNFEKIENESQTSEPGNTEKSTTKGDDSVESDESTEATFPQVSTEISPNKSKESPNLENRVAEDQVKTKPSSSRDAQDIYGGPVIRNRYQQPTQNVDYLAPNYPSQIGQQTIPGQPISPPQPYQQLSNPPISNPVSQQHPIKYYQESLDYLNAPTGHLPQVNSENQYVPPIKYVPNYPASVPDVPQQQSIIPTNQQLTPVFFDNPDELVQPIEPHKQNTYENEVQEFEQGDPIPPYKQDPVQIYVPEGQINDNFYVGNAREENPKTADDNKSDDPNLTSSRNMESWFETEYHKLKKWVDENVGMAQKTEAIVGEKAPTQNKDIVHNVNDIINSVTVTAKDLNEKITDLVKKSGDSPELELNTKSPSETYVVKLGNGKAFRTQLSPEEHDQISDKLNENWTPAITNVHPYDKHPRLTSVYRNGKWEYVKLPPNDLVGSQPQLIDGPDVVENVPSQREPFIDPQLLDMKSIIQNVKRVPDYLFKNANDVVDILQSGQDKKEIPPQIEPKLEINAKKLDEHQSPKITSRIDDNANETVACSDEESDEYLRENKSENPLKVEENDENRNRMVPNTGRDITQENVTTTDTKDPPQLKEEMLGSRQTINEGGTKSDTEIIETTTMDDTVACSKEEKDKYEMIHFQPAHSYDDYNGYRSTDKKPEHTKLHVPTIQEILRPKALDKILHPKPIDDIVHPKSKASSNHDHHRKHPPSPTKPRPQDEIDDQSDENRSNEEADKIHEGHSNKDTAKHFPDQYQFKNAPNFVPPERMRQMSPYMPFDANQPMFQDPRYPGSYSSNQNLIPGPIPPNMQQRYQNWPNGQGNMNEVIGSPRLEPMQGSLNHLGKFIPNHDQLLSLHSRDVSDENKLRNMYFVGDGIKLPLNMKEHGDGSLHLSVDVNSLCDCKHCDGKQIHNGTLVLEANMDGAQSSEDADDVPLAMASPTLLNGETDGQNLQVAAVDGIEINDEEKNATVSKRSLRTKNSLEKNKLEKDSEFHSNDIPRLVRSYNSNQEVSNKLIDPKEGTNYNNVSSDKFAKQKIGLLSWPMV